VQAFKAYLADLADCLATKVRCLAHLGLQQLHLRPVLPVVQMVVHALHCVWRPVQAYLADLADCLATNVCSFMHAAVDFVGQDGLLSDPWGYAPFASETHQMMVCM
jgi:hypothetical protein